MSLTPNHWRNIHRKNTCVVTLGNFDGVHLGHRKILDTLMDISQRRGIEPVLITYSPHPIQYFKKEKAFALINTLNEKIRQLKSLYPVTIILLSFEDSLAKLDAKSFINQFLQKRLKAEAFVFGYDHHFGVGGRGNANSLIEFGGIHPNDIVVVDPIQVDGITISSSKIRRLIKNGAIEKANKLLGYRFFYKGEVIHGRARGRLLGFPTANVEVNEAHKIIGKLGVYGAVAKLADKEYYALVNIGKNPTFGDHQITIETYLIDFDQDIYGQNLTVELNSFRRKEMKFNTKEELINQIEWDINTFKQSLNLKKKSISG